MKRTKYLKILQRLCQGTIVFLRAWDYDKTGISFLRQPCARIAYNLTEAAISERGMCHDSLQKHLSDV